ncbi:MAG: hypothetical protein E5299_01130 [Burkholderia gladioli]|nr:MAG: hypothetical protein E5299_01130 [Burkholderia gladioli]
MNINNLRLTILGLTMSLAFPAASSTADSEKPTYIKPRMDFGSSSAGKTLLADFHQLADTSPKPQIRDFAQSMLDRSHGQLSSSGKHAKSCFDASMSPELTALALVCANAWMASAVLQGDLPEQERRSAYIRAKLYPMLSDAMQGRDVRVWALEAQLPKNSSVPAFSSTQPTGPGRITTFKQDHASGRLYMTKVVINGVSIEALVDTGTTRSALSESDASRVGAAIIPGAKRAGGPTEDGAHEISLKVGVLKTVQWGDLRMKNYAVGIWDGPFSAIGLDFIGQLPSPLHVSEKQLDYGAKGMPSECSGALALGGDLSGGRTKVYLSGRINKNPPAPILLDTGASGSLNSYAKSNTPIPDRLGTVKVLQGNTKFTVRSGPIPVVLGVGHGAFDIEAMRFLDLASDDPDAIGSGILDKHSLWLDFPNERGCVD